jgi:hypothetical protein
LGLLTRLSCLTVLVVSSPLQAQNPSPSAPASTKQDQAAATLTRGDGGQTVVQGRLQNGLRYAILPRRTREPGVGLLMRNEGGFIAERRPGERGLAHLIEHIVFHSPTRTAPGELDRFLRVGLPLTFPAPNVATTTWRESNFFISSRTTKPADIDTLLGLFREVAGELTFRADAVDGERASVMREMAEKKRGNDISARYVAAVAPGSPNDVIDAQNSDDVPTASVDTIRALYHRLYRPENMMVVVVGDVDAPQIEALIKKRFGGWRGAGPRPNRAPIPTFRPGRILPISHSALAEARTSATITVTAPLPPPARTRRQQADATLMDMLALRAINYRLSLTQAAGPPGKFGAFIENGEQGPHRLIMLWDNFVPGQWRPAVTGLKRTACELSTIGVSEQDWTTAKQYLLQDLERRAADIPNVELAKDLSHALADERHLIPPDEMVRHARAVLPTISARAMNAWWRRQWSAGVEHLRVESPELAQVDNPETAIRATVDEATRNVGCKVRPNGAGQRRGARRGIVRPDQHFGRS